MTLRSCPPARARLTPLASALHVALHVAFTAPLAWGAMAQAQTQTQTQTQTTPAQYDIPAGPLAETLNRFAQQAGVALVVDAAKVEGLRTAGLKGRYGVDEGFDALLRNSGYAISKTAAGYVLVTAAAVPKPQATEATLPTVKVQAAASGATQGYGAQSTDAIAPGLSQKETPAVVNVVTSDFLKDAGASRFNDVLNYIPGVTTADNVGSPTEALSMRGFPLGVAALGATGTYFNGMRQAVTSGQYRALENIERVEIVKGPAGVEASVSDPGGFVNFITKKPQKEFAAEAKVGVGDYGYRTVGVDVTGPLSASPSLQYRLIAAHNELAVWRPGRDKRPQDLIAPSLNWDYAAGSHVALEYEHFKTNDPLDRGTIYLRGVGFKDDFAGRDWSYHQSSDSMLATTQRVDLDWTHTLASGWQTKLRVQDMKQDQVTNAFRNNDASGLYAADGLSWNGRTPIPIFITHDKSRLEAQSAELSLRGDFQTGALNHTVNFGLSKNRSRDAFVSYDGDHLYWDNDNSIDVFAPDNHQTVNVIDTFEGGDFKRGSDLKSAFAQWLTRWTPAWRTVVSLRRDDYDGFAVSETPDGTEPTYHPIVSNELTSWRVASSYDVTDRVTLFGGYGNSYVPQPGADFSKRPIDPLRAQSIEAGVKTALFDGKALWTNSIYQITQDRLTVCDPIDPVDCRYLMVYGKVRMRGVESELIGQVSRNLQLSAGLSVIDPEIVQNGEGFSGNQYPNVPRFQASAFAHYHWGAWGLPDLGTRLGVMRVGKRDANSGNTYQLPAYFRVDAGVSYAFNAKTSLDLNIENVFDETYYTSAQDGGMAADQIGVGNRRLMQLILRMKM